MSPYITQRSLSVQPSFSKWVLTWFYRPGYKIRETVSLSNQLRYSLVICSLLQYCLDISPLLYFRILWTEQILLWWDKTELLVSKLDLKVMFLAKRSSLNCETVSRKQCMHHPRKLIKMSSVFVQFIAHLCIDKSGALKYQLAWEMYLVMSLSVNRELIERGDCIIIPHMDNNGNVLHKSIFYNKRKHFSSPDTLATQRYPSTQSVLHPKLAVVGIQLQQ